MDDPRPTYTDIVLAYLTEGYRAWQAHERGAAAEVAARMGLSVEEDLNFRRELGLLDLIASIDYHDDPAEFWLLPKGIALMDGSTMLDSLIALPSAAMDQAALTPEAAASAKRGWTTVVRDWAVKKGLEVTWDSRRDLWELLRARYPWLPAWPGAPDGSV